MSFRFEQPLFFLLILALLPILFYTVFKLRTVIRLLNNYTGQNSQMMHSVKARVIARVVLWSFAWIFLCIALAGPSWGTELVPVQRSGRAVSFVFDISYSMMAKDISEDATLTRLDSSKQFSQEMISYLPGVAASAVLAKGDGLLAVPLTEDFYALSNLIMSLSPTMLSHPGSSLSKGILQAIDSFPPQSARSSYILVMSDGDDTDENLASAVDKAVSFGIHVIFVGFGTPLDVEVLAGDGETRVKTALRVEKLQALSQNNFVDFIFANDANAIQDILKIIKPSVFFADDGATTGYEISPIKRHSLFIGLAIFVFCLGFFVYTFVPEKIMQVFFKRSKGVLLVLVITSSGLFTGCNDWFTDAKDVFEGSFYWTQQNYQESVASFLEVSTRSQESNNKEVLQYGLFGLSANYITQGEIEASLIKINEMDPVVPKGLDFARWYNKGIIFHRQGDYANAAFCFKKALLIDSSNIQAKINLELCSEESTAQSQQGIQERIPVSEQQAPSGAGDAIFSLIRENEGNQWKDREVAPEESSIIDY